MGVGGTTAKEGPDGLAEVGARAGVLWTPKRSERVRKGVTESVSFGDTITVGVFGAVMEFEWVAGRRAVVELAEAADVEALGIGDGERGFSEGRRSESRMADGVIVGRRGLAG